MSNSLFSKVPLKGMIGSPPCAFTHSKICRRQPNVQNGRNAQMQLFGLHCQRNFELDALLESVSPQGVFMLHIPHSP